MNKILAIAGLLSLLGAALAHFTGQGLGVFLLMGIIGGILIIVGLAGKP